MTNRDPPMRAPHDSSATGGETGADQVFEKLALGLAERPLGAADDKRLRSRILARARRSAPLGTVTLHADDGTWNEMAAGVAAKVLRVDSASRNRTLLIRMSPGSCLAAHAHTQEEECFVIDGEVLIGNHRLSAGDMHVARVGSTHEAIRAPAGALLLVRAELPAGA